MAVAAVLMTFAATSTLLASVAIITGAYSAPVEMVETVGVAASVSIWKIVWSARLGTNTRFPWATGLPTPVPVPSASCVAVVVTAPFLTTVAVPVAAVPAVEGEAPVAVEVVAVEDEAPVAVEVVPVAVPGSTMTMALPVPVTRLATTVRPFNRHATPPPLPLMSVSLLTTTLPVPSGLLLLA